MSVDSVASESELGKGLERLESPKAFPCMFTSFSMTATGRMGLGVRIPENAVNREEVRALLCKRRVSVECRERLGDDDPDQSYFDELPTAAFEAETGPISDNKTALSFRLSCSDAVSSEALILLSGRNGTLTVLAVGEKQKAKKEKPKYVNPDQQALPFEAWRILPIDTLTERGVSVSQCEKLQQAGIDTLGELQERMKTKGEWWAQDIKGIGEAARTKIVDVFNEIVTEAEQANEEEEGDE